MLRCEGVISFFLIFLSDKARDKSKELLRRKERGWKGWREGGSESAGCSIGEREEERERDRLKLKIKADVGGREEQRGEEEREGWVRRSGGEGGGVEKTAIVIAGRAAYRSASPSRAVEVTAVPG